MIRRALLTIPFLLCSVINRTLKTRNCRNKQQTEPLNFLEICVRKGEHCSYNTNYSHLAGGGLDTSIHVSSQPSISTAIQAITIHLPHQHTLPFMLLPHASHEQLYTDLHSTQHMMLVWSVLITSYTTHAITKCQTITCIKINSDHMPRRITGYQTKPCNVYQTWKTQGTWVWYFKLNAGIL